MTTPPFAERLTVAVKRPEFYLLVAVEICALTVFIMMAMYRYPASVWGRVACLLIVLAAMTCSMILTARRVLAPLRGYGATKRGRP